MSDEDIATTLADAKSPKFSKRTTFQEELQEALNTHSATQLNSDYSDDFESDEGGTVEELPGTVETTSKKSVAFTDPLSNYNLSSAGTLKRGNVDDLGSSDDGARPQQVSNLTNEILSEKRGAISFSLTGNSGSYDRSAAKKSVAFELSPPNDYALKREMGDVLEFPENECRHQELPENQKLSELRQEDGTELSASDERSAVGGESEQQYDGPMTEEQIERDDGIQHNTETKPVPKPREFKAKAASASAENISTSALEDYSKPSPHPRNVLRKSGRLEANEGIKAEDRAAYKHRSFSLSAPSSLTRLNQGMKSEKRALSESPGPEGPWIASSSTPFPIHFSSVDEITGDSNLISGEESYSKEQEQKETDNYNCLTLRESGRKSPSVLELMMTTVYEKTKKLHKSSDDPLEEKLQSFELDATENGLNEITKDDKSEQKIALSTSKAVPGASKDSVKEEVEEKGKVTQKTKSSPGRTLSTTFLKKTGRPVPISRSTSSQYLGTLKVLDNQHLQKYSADLDKADSLRAAVYQDWLAKKRIFLLELQRIKRNKVENLQEKNEKKDAAKKEEAIASFEAWKAMKEKEAKKLAEKKRLEEEKKRKEAELNEKKKEDAQKAAFEKWKEKKAEYLKQQTRREKRGERIKKKKEEVVVAEKKKDNRSAVEKWNEKKEEFLKQKKKEKIQGRRKEVEEQVEKEEKDKRAIEEYERWLEKKEMKEKCQKMKQLHVILEDETSPPWSPPGKAVSSRSY